MKVKREILNNLTLKGWCAVCADYTANEKIHTGMPGIQCFRCPACLSHFQANLLEDNDDLLDVDDNLKLPDYVSKL